MADRLKEILAKVMEWWKKFTSKQKTIIIGVSAMVIFTFAILIFVFTKPQYTRLITCENTTDAAGVIEILNGAGIQHRETDDGLLIEVLVDQLSAANIALGSAGYAPDDYDIDDVVSGGFNTTEADKQKRYRKYLERKLQSDFESYNAIKSALVHLNIPDQDGTLISQKVEASAYIRLELADTFTSENAANLARATATALGNQTTSNITIVDTDANLLFSGAEDQSMMGIASSQVELRNQAESLVSAQVRKVLMGTNQFDNVEVTPHLKIDYSNYESQVREYYANEGRDEGMKSHEEVAESENNSGSGGVPGAESNDETQYPLLDDGNTSSSSTERATDFLPNERNEYSVTPAGGIEFDESSLSAAAIKYVELREEDAKSQGLLDGTTWAAFKAANEGAVKQEVDPEFKTMVAKASGINEDDVVIMAYQQYLFYDKEGLNVSTTDVLSIVMLVIILGLLAFVVLRSMVSKRAVQETEELSVENLLQSTPEAELENIDLENKSETRKLIEKFVDENPEASANLLRNWLNEDWS